MDPNEALRVLRQYVEANLAFAEGVQEHPDGMTENEESLSGCVVEIATTFQALDEWLCRGGFAPKAWQLLDVQWRDVVGGPPDPLGPPNPAHGELP